MALSEQRGFKTESAMESDASEEEDSTWLAGAKPEEIDIPVTEFEEDMFGMVICSLVRDSRDMMAGNGHVPAKACRLLTTMMLLFFCIGIQTFLLLKVKQFVSAKAVHDIRAAYDKFEITMYMDTTLNANGKHRGVAGTFNASRFDELSADDQSAACRIPLSQPDFFFVILVIWTLTCCYELRQCIFLFRTLIFNTKTIPSMKDALKDFEDEATEGDDYLLDGLTVYMKVVIVTLVILPRALITMVLTWLGCRWLLATNNFADLILNAVALEFILTMKEMLYHTLMTRKNKGDVGTTKLRPAIQKENAGVFVFVGAALWIVVAAAWVALYMGIPHKMEGLQLVLPDYRWDVHEVCTAWVEWRYCVAEVCPASPS
mmetsp:Transcript_45226/g.96615  ORF Transcript_45226/g.96615 Transcript_45226/m.96615 type:complete len:374 (-) Transcript_45226:36-1157(-)